MFTTIITGIIEGITTSPAMDERGRAIYRIAQVSPGRQYPVRISCFGPAKLAVQGELVSWAACSERRTVQGSKSNEPEYSTNVSFVCPMSAEALVDIDSVVMAEATRYQMAELSSTVTETVEETFAPAKAKAKKATKASKVKA